MSFALDLAKFAEKVKEKANDAVGLIVLNVVQEIDKRSPVGDASYWITPAPKGYVGGRFRGNWQLGVDVLLTGETGRIDTRGGVTVSAALAAIPEDAAGRVFYYVNNTPYAQRIEDGWSRQAPEGVVGLTVIGWQERVNKIVGEMEP